MTQTGRPSDFDRVEVDRLAPRDEDEGYVTGEGWPATERRFDDHDLFEAMGAARLVLVSLLGALVIVGLLLAVAGAGLIFLAIAVVALVIAGGIVTAFVRKTTSSESRPVGPDED